MAYDFTTRVDRKGTGASKWEQMYQLNPNVADDVLPLSVADMEFKTAPEIVEGLQDFLNDAVLGYTNGYDDFYKEVIAWNKRRHNWEIKEEWIVNTSGVVGAFNTGIRSLTEEGEGVIIFKPVYFPFSTTIEQNKRKEVNVPLILEDGDYRIDYAGFEEAAKDANNKLLLFCSPHNPVGRVWTKEELEKVIEIANRHDLYVISDEIWYDIIMPGYEHTVMSTLDEEINERLITMVAPSKTFNLAGLMTSHVVIQHKALREKYEAELAKVHLNSVGILGYKACELAYSLAEGWAQEMLTVIDQNQHVVHNFFKENYPDIKAPLIEGTYVQWVDFNALGMSTNDLNTFLHKEAQFFTGSGHIFGAEGAGYQRINLALPTDALEEALERLDRALDLLSK